MGIDWIPLLWILGLLLLSLSVHESAHAVAADSLGDATARRLGRVTLNPLSHIDPFGTVLFPLICFMFGGVIFGWARPVPVNPAYLKNPRQDHALIAAAGPASNVLLGVVFLVLLKACHAGLLPSVLAEPALWGIRLNVILAVFNLLPIPPLDGGWILEGILPEGLARLVAAIRPYGFILLLALLYTNVFSMIYRPVWAFVRVLTL